MCDFCVTPSLDKVVEWFSLPTEVEEVRFVFQRLLVDRNLNSILNIKEAGADLY